MNEPKSLFCVNNREQQIGKYQFFFLVFTKAMIYIMLVIVL